MSDLNAKIVADLKRELAEAKAAANKVTESMGSEIMRLHGEIEQQREYHRTSMQAAQTTADVALRSATPLAAKLAAIRAPLAGVDVVALLHGESRRASCNATIEQAQWCDNYQDAARARDELAMVDAALRFALPALLAAAREALEP